MPELTEDTVKKNTLLFLEKKAVIKKGDTMKNYVISKKEVNRNI